MGSGAEAGGTVAPSEGHRRKSPETLLRTYDRTGAELLESLAIFEGVKIFNHE